MSLTGYTSKPRPRSKRATGQKRLTEAQRAHQKKTAHTSKLKDYLKKNPSNVKGHKVKGGRAVSLRGFTGTVTLKSNGQVIIRGKARKR